MIDSSSHPRGVAPPPCLRRLLASFGVVLLAILATADESCGQGAHDRTGRPIAETGQRFTELTRAATWRRVRAIPLQFRTYHPQGMTRVGDRFFLSTVEVTKPRRPIGGEASETDGKHEQTPGAGRAHLFRITAEGERTGAVELSVSDMYHPGGIDYDGRYIWVPVAEYRPNSQSIIYRVDPETMEATAVFRVDDHIGAVVFDAANERIHGVSWSAKRFYTWDHPEAQDSARARTGTDLQPRAPSRAARNSSYYIAYQDCQSVGEGYALCGGLRDYPIPGSEDEMAFGGLELVDFEAPVPVWQLPLSLYASPGIPMTRNPFYAEPSGDSGLRLYFAPEDDRSTIYVYDVTPN